MTTTRSLLAIICWFAFLITTHSAPSHQTNQLSKRTQNPRQLIRRSPALNSLLPRHPFPQQETNKEKDRDKSKDDKDKDKAKDEKAKEDKAKEDKAKEDKAKEDKTKDKTPEQGGSKNGTDGGTLSLNQPPPPVALATTVTVQNTPNVQQVPVRSASNPNVIQDAAAALNLATKNVDNAVMVLQNSKSNEAEVKKAAQEALKNESSEDFLRQVLASAAQDPVAAQGSLAIIRDKAPIVVNGFKDIIKSASNPTKVVETLKDVVIARLQVVQANMDLIGGIPGGDRKLVATSQVSPSQAAVGRQLDTNQKKTVDQAQRNLKFQMKTVDEAITNIQKQGISPPEIEAAAKIALVQEAAQDFCREVLASAASDPKAAMEALEIVRDHGPNEIIAGLTALASNAKDPGLVKKNIELVIKGRESVVPANLKLIELAGGAGGSSNTTEKASNGTGVALASATTATTPPPGAVTASGAKDANGVSLANAPPPPPKTTNLTVEGGAKTLVDKNGVPLAGTTAGTVPAPPPTSIDGAKTPVKDPTGVTPNPVDPLKLNSLGLDQSGTSGGMMQKQDPRLLLASQLAASGNGPDSSVLLYGLMVSQKQPTSTITPGKP